MALRNIIKDGDPALLKKSRVITVFDSRLHQLLDDMAETMEDANGAGLAAVQVGVIRRVCIVDVGDGIVELINPKIIAASSEVQTGPEGCLSFPGLYGTVTRPVKVTVEAQDRYGDPFTVEGEGLKTRALCHEIDHLDGIVFRTHATELFSAEELARREELEQKAEDS